MTKKFLIACLLLTVSDANAFLGFGKKEEPVKAAEKKVEESTAPETKSPDVKADNAKPAEVKVDAEKQADATPEAAAAIAPAATPAATPAPVKSEKKKVDCHFDPSKGFANVVEQALPAVVNVATTQIVEGRSEKQEMPEMPGGQGSPFDELFKRFFEQQERPRRVQSLGSGFIIKVDKTTAYIVTNFHVVADAKKISIFLHDKTEVEAKVHGSDERTDIAVLKINLETLPENKRDLTAVSWEDSDESRVGDWVIAIGNPFGLGSSVTVGVVSSKGRDIIARGKGRLSDYVDDYIQHSAQINFGNSGGCLLSTTGRVIGINTAIFSPSGGNVGIGFAIPVGVAKATVDQLIEFGRTRRGWLGVKIQNLTEEMAESLGIKGGGAIVSSVTKGGPADAAKIEPHDIFVEYDGKPINEHARLSRLVGETKVGSEVKIKILRKGKAMDMKIKIGEYEDTEQKDPLDEDGNQKKGKNAQEQTQSAEVAGITVSVLTQQMRDRLGDGMKDAKGLLVLKVDPASVASEIGLSRGDVLHEANQKELNVPKDFAAIVDKAKADKKKSVLLLVYREGEPRYVLLRFEDDASNGADEKDAKDKQVPEESLKDKDAPKGKDAMEHPGNQPKAVL